MKYVSVLAAALILATGLANLLGMGVMPMREATAAEIETVALKSTKGGCPGGQGFCCLHDQRRLQSALEGVNGVSEVTPDKKTKTFTVVYERERDILPDLKRSAQQVGFEVVEMKKIP